MKFRHQVTRLLKENNKITGVEGNILQPSDLPRGEATSREVTGEYRFYAPHVLISWGGIGANLGLVRQSWPERLGKAPENMDSVVTAYVNSTISSTAAEAGAHNRH